MPIQIHHSRKSDFISPLILPECDFFVMDNQNPNQSPSCLPPHFSLFFFCASLYSLQLRAEYIPIYIQLSLICLIKAIFSKKTILPLNSIQYVQTLWRPFGLCDSLWIHEICIHRCINHSNLLMREQNSIRYILVLMNLSNRVADIGKAFFMIKLAYCNCRIDIALHIKLLDRPQLDLCSIRIRPMYLSIRFLVTANADLYVMLKHRTIKPLKILRMHPIVAVHEVQPLTVAVCKYPVNARITRGGQSLILLMDDIHARILLCIFIADCAAVVRAAVVHKDQLEVHKRLHENAVHTAAEIRFNLVDGNNNSDFVEFSGCTLDANGITYDSVYARSSHVFLYNCGLYNALQGLECYLAQGNVKNCCGSCSWAMVSYASLIIASGTVPAGSRGTGENGLLYANSVTTDYGTAIPTVTPDETGILYATTTKSWRGSWRTDTLDVIQGVYYDSGYNSSLNWNRGCMWFSNAQNLLSGCTVKSATLTLHRKTGSGSSSAKSVYLCAITNTSASGTPSIARNYGAIGTIGRDKQVTFSIPVDAVQGLADGYYGGLCLYETPYNFGSSTYSNAYMRMSGTDTNYEPYIECVFSVSTAVG